MLLAYINRSITHRVHFLDKASRDLFICAKDLFVEATASPQDMGRCLQAQHSRPWLARLAAMPEVLPVQFMQMFCSYGVKLRLDFAVADKCNSNYKQRCANDPQSQKATSPIHCSAKLDHQLKLDQWLSDNEGHQLTDRTQLKLKYSHHEQPQQHRHYD